MNQRGFILPSPYLLIGVAVAFAFSNLFSYMKGREHVGIEFAEFRTQVEAENERIRERDERARQASAAASAEREAHWGRIVADLRNRGHVRVQPVCNPGGVPSVPGVAGEPAESHVEKPRPSSEGVAITAAECESRLNAAIPDAAWIELVKGWVADQRKASMTK